MGLIREHLDVDFIVDPKPLNQKEKASVSQYIREYKQRKTEKTSSVSKKVKQPV